MAQSWDVIVIGAGTTGMVAAMRSRIMGLISMGIGISPFGLLHVSLLADHFGPRLASSVIGIEALVILALVAWRWRGRLG